MNPSFNTIFFPNDLQRDRFKALDGLRGMAVLFVLLSHSSNQNIFFYKYLNFQSIGKTGVYLFFILSAYLLDRQIAIALMSGRSTKLFWLNYFLRRFLRIYPLFTVALLVFAFATMAGLNTDVELSDIPFHLLLIKAKSIFWSIAVEFKYYFISPFLLLICHRFLKWRPTATILFLFTVIIVIIILRNRLPLNTTFTISYLPVFMTGTVIAVYELILKEKIKLNKYAGLIEFAGLASFLIILLTIPFYFEKITGTLYNFQDPLFLFPYALLWGAVLTASKYGSGLLKRFFEFKFLRFLGTISFSLYLFHLPVLLLIDSRFLHIPQELKIYLFFIICILVSIVTYLLIERPLSKIKLYKQELTEEQIKSRRINSSSGTE